MGSYIKKVTKATKTIDGIVIAASKFGMREPTFRDFDIPAVERKYNNMIDAGKRIAAGHRENGVEYMMESGVCNLDELFGTNREVPIIKVAGCVSEYAFDKPIAKIYADGKTLKLRWIEETA